MARYRETTLPPPWLKKIWIDDAAVTDRSGYPFHLPIFRAPGFELTFDKPITIIVGDNGVGKSTILEGIGALAGFDPAGGGKGYRPVNHEHALEDDGDVLTGVLKASWLPKTVGHGWFFRADAFFSVARYLDDAAREVNEVGPDFLSHSHGEGFLRFFEERCTRQGLFIFDEPESALAPHRQFEFIKLLVDQGRRNRMQAIIATHSPFIMATPGAEVLLLDRQGLNPVDYRDTPHFRLYTEFVLDPWGTVEAMITS